MLIFDHFLAILKFFGIYSLVTLNKGPLNTLLHLEEGGVLAGCKTDVRWGGGGVILHLNKRKEKKERKRQKGCSN